MTNRYYGSFVKIDGNNMEIHNERLQGHYMHEPVLGEPFYFYAGSRYLRTSLIQEITPNENGFVVKTMNSTYSFTKNI